MQDPKPYAVLRDGKFVFTIHTRSIEAAREIVAARLGGEDVKIVPATDAHPQR